ncbi:MAG: hypothetical protein ABII00_16070 [Elusimicrobiota bacterium]
MVPAHALMLALIVAPIFSEASGPEPPPAAGGWRATPSSLLLFNHDGRLINEIGLGSWRDELDGGLVSVRRMRGGIADGGRFAWHWQKFETIRTGQVDEVLGSTKTFVYLGTTGQPLWRDDAVEAPPHMAPVLLSRDGETALVIEARKDGWTLAAVSFTGNRIMELDVAERLEKVSFTSDGRFAMALWGALDEPLIYSFLDLLRKQRKDIPAADAPLGQARIDEDGVVIIGGEAAFRFP